MREGDSHAFNWKYVQRPTWHGCRRGQSQHCWAAPWLLSSITWMSLGWGQFGNWVRLKWKQLISSGQQEGFNTRSTENSHPVWFVLISQWINALGNLTVSNWSRQLQIFGLSGVALLAGTVWSTSTAAGGWDGISSRWWWNLGALRCLAQNLAGGETGTAEFAHDGWSLICFRWKRLWRQGYPINNV